MVARSTWFEVHAQSSFDFDLRAASPNIEVTCKVSAVAMKQNSALVSQAVHRFDIGSRLLYVCSHNPMTDLNIVEMKELLAKASREILVMLILPVCEAFSRDLEKPSTTIL